MGHFTDDFVPASFLFAAAFAPPPAPPAACFAAACLLAISFAVCFCWMPLRPILDGAFTRNEKDWSTPFCGWKNCAFIYHKLFDVPHFRNYRWIFRCPWFDLGSDLVKLPHRLCMIRVLVEVDSEHTCCSCNSGFHSTMLQDHKMRNHSTSSQKCSWIFYVTTTNDGW